MLHDTATASAAYTATYDAIRARLAR
jgi:hypothetical protein